MTIPRGTHATLRYYAKVSKVYPPYLDNLKVTMGPGLALDSIREPLVADGSYVLRTVSLDDFADGTEYTLSFIFTAPDSRVSSFNVDDITIDVQCPGASPDDIRYDDGSRTTTDREHPLLDGDLGGAFLPDLPKRALGFEKAGRPPESRIRERSMAP